MAVDNRTILGSWYISQNNDFQQRIPDPSVNALSRVANAMFDPLNNDIYDAFTGDLLRVIGDQRISGKRWVNPWRVFKEASTRYGRTIEEIVTKWLPAHAYKVEPSELLKVYRPENLVAYHSEDSRLVYKLTIQRDLLESAFYDEFGIDRYINSVYDAAFSSAEYDEYDIMKQRIADHATSPDLGFFQVQYTAVPNDEAGAKQLLKDLRTYAKKIEFPSSLYNARSVEGAPTFARPEEMVLITTPEVQATLDVDALAALFHIERADVPYRIMTIDEFPIPGAFALLCSENFLIARDTLYQVREFEDIDTLNLQWRLHKWGIFSTSPFVPAILFTTDTATTVPVVTVNPTGFTLAAEGGATTVEAGGELQLVVDLTGTVSPATPGVDVLPDAALFEVTGENSAGDPVNVYSTTYVDDAAVLHVSPRLAAGTVLTVKATSAYVNPSGATTSRSATLSLTVA